MAAVLAASVLAALVYVLIRRMRGVDADVIVFFFAAVSVVLALPFIAAHAVIPHGGEWLVLLGMLGDEPPAELVTYQPSWHHGYAVVWWRVADARQPPLSGPEGIAGLLGGAGRVGNGEPHRRSARHRSDFAH